MSKRNCRLAAIQMVSGPRVADNLAAAGRLVAEAVAQGAELVVLPEYFPIIGAADADRVRAREDLGRGPVQDWLAATAREHGIWLFAGSIPLTASVPDKMRNAMLVYDPFGERVERYDKLHLFAFSKGDSGDEREGGGAPVTPSSVPRYSRAGRRERPAGRRGWVSRDAGLAARRRRRRPVAASWRIPGGQ